jgi:hypothetical protein
VGTVTARRQGADVKGLRSKVEGKNVKGQGSRERLSKVEEKNVKVEGLRRSHMLAFDLGLSTLDQAR